MESNEDGLVIMVLIVAEMVVLPELGPQVVKAMRKVQEAMYSTISFHVVDI